MIPSSLQPAALARALLDRLPEPARILLGFLPEDDPFGMLARFADPAALIRVAAAMRKAGYRRFDAHSPFPIHGMERAMGVRRSPLPWIVLGGGLVGFACGLGLQVWINVFDYPLVTSGKPFLSLPAFIPVTFELTVLFSAFAAIGGMLLLNILPMLYHPLLKSRNFARATSDGFFISVEARDPLFDAERTREFLESLGGKNVELLKP
jgi:hypothetical protein